MLQTCDVGHRVVIRRRVGIGPHGRPVFTDLLGELVEFDPLTILIRTDDGIEHTIPHGDVEAAKRIPPRPTKYSEIDALERIADRSWPAPTHERLGGWFLRAAEGFTNRANSALPLGDPGLPLAQAIATSTSWYADRGLTARITVPLPLRRDVADALTRLGWHAQPLVLVQTAALPSLRHSPATTALAPTGGPVVELLSEPSDDFLRVVAARKTSLPDSAHRILTGPELVRFAEIRDGGQVVAIARAAVVDTWMHIGLVEVATSARRRGYARAVTAALAAWAATQHATRALLQVEEHNTAAVNLYAAMGFTTHHTYITHRAPTHPETVDFQGAESGPTGPQAR